ncbi:hypothetical protein GCM10010994_27610 [Chelatococcus reniformis]|uniref:Uncharacterized protein n=2 Tax=Chelatococcus reniformis TaxID=1494448 RepID=A0A916XF69_9HYPH|nr:hypothetical protein GCM10010994_27610 [Chelatococcus reniformis]
MTSSAWRPWVARATAGVVLAMAAAAPVTAYAQAAAPGCEKIRGYLEERKNLVGRIQGMSKGGKKLDARKACGIFGQLANNGVTMIKWLESNKAWCQIPDQFIGGIKQDNVKAVTIRGQACKVAAQMETMEKRARQQAAQGGGAGGPSGPLGGPGLTGEIKIPQGAL